MLDRIKYLISRSAYAIPVIFSVLILGGFVGAGAYYLYKNKPEVKVPKTSIVSDIVDSQKKTATDAINQVSQDIADVIKTNPPKTNGGNYSTSSVRTSAGKATVVSTGGSSGSSSKVEELATEGPATNFKYVDSTGAYPDLGRVLQNYLDASLLHSSEISYMYEVDTVDCPSCDYGGYWTGSYIYQGNDIIKAFGYITLNVGPYKSSPYFTDYMKLIFSHEYGHHYTMYHRWVDLDIPSGERFPTEYYSIRPLDMNTTAPDYSLGWANCDSEVIADDYSYIYSGYGYHGSANLHGYPSLPATKTYLESLSGASAPANTSQSNPTPVADTTAPSVVITSPSDGAEVSGVVAISAVATDNVGVSYVDFSVDGTVKSTKTSAPFTYSWNSAQVTNGEHLVLVRGYDSAGNNNSSSIVIIVNNQAEQDTQPPSVSISDPSSNPYAWSSGNLRISAASTDNVAVSKIEFYINGTLVASENSAAISRIWIYASTPSGSYILKAKAYDAAGNASETSITINKS